MIRGTAIALFTDDGPFGARCLLQIAFVFLYAVVAERS
jgi:hypothetical protein